MRLIAYDFEALVRTAQQASLDEGLAEIRPWLADVRASARAHGGFGRDRGQERGDARVFDPALVDETLAHLETARAALGHDRPLRELIGETPEREIAPRLDGWRLYDDLVRTWTGLVSAPWTERDLAGEGLLARLSDAVGADLRLGRESALCRGIGMPYPATWRGKPRARIYHVTTDALDALWEAGNDEVARAAAALGRPADEVRAQMGALLNHFERARTMDTVVAIDPDDSFWS